MQKIKIYVKSINFLSLRVITIVTDGYHTVKPFYSTIPLFLLTEFRSFFLCGILYVLNNCINQIV